MSTTQFVRISWQSDLYRQSLKLRDSVLRIPLGSKLSDDDILAERDQVHFGAIREETIIGCVVVVRIDGQTVKLRQMVIDPDHQARGIGSLLIRHVESELAHAGCRRIILHARTTAIPFYTKHGYAKEGHEFIEVAIPHVKMSKSLMAE